MRVMLAYSSIFLNMYMARSHTSPKGKLRRSDFANVVLNIQNHAHVSRETWKKVAPKSKVG